MSSTNFCSDSNLECSGGVDAVDGPVKDGKRSLCVKGARIDIRADPARLQCVVGNRGYVIEPLVKRQRKDHWELVDFVSFQVPRLIRSAEIPRQILRISAGRAASAAGIHPWTDMGDLFLDFVYQDLPDVLLRDAMVVGLDVVHSEAERARLLAKSGEAVALEDALRRSAEADWVHTAIESRNIVSRLIDAAKCRGSLCAEEAQDLLQKLHLEINLEFGARHEAAAIRAYEAYVGSNVFGEQRRVFMGFPEVDSKEALHRVLPSLRQEPLPREEVSTACEHGKGHSIHEQFVERDGSTGSADDYFRLTGFVDGLVDLPRKQGQEGSAYETVVVEVKHRMNKIQNPPNIYDVVQLCCYCRVFGLVQGHLVECLREENLTMGISSSVGRLAVTVLDFSEGSPDRRGWDEHVLPALYNVAKAVYEIRNDEALRLRLLAAASTKDRNEFVRAFCPHIP